MSVFQKIGKFIFGYDIFISYSRKDSLDYAYAIAQYFMKKGHECYIDQLSSIMPGENLPSNIKEAVKRSTSFVLIGSEGAQQSKPIGDEITLFLENNKNKPFIPITIDGAINVNADWNKKIVGLALIDDTKANAQAGSPSQDVLDRIENALIFTKKSKRLRNIALTITVLVLLIAGSAAGVTSYQISEANKKINTAQAKVKDAEIRLHSANEKEQAAEKETTKQLNAANLARLEAANANVLKAKAIILQKEAAAQALLAKRSALNQQRIAAENKKLADHYENVSFARNLASQANLENAENPQLAAQKVMFALKQFQNQPEIDPLVEKTFRTIAAAQTGYALRPFKEEVTAVSISRNMAFVAVGDHNGGIGVFDISNRKHIQLVLHRDEYENIFRVAFDSTGRYLLALTGHPDSVQKSLQIFTVTASGNSGKVIKRVNCLTAEVSSDLSTIAMVDTNRRVSIYGFDENIASVPTVSFSLPSNEKVTCLRFSNDNKRLAIGLGNSLVELWNVNGDKLPFRIISTNHYSYDDSTSLEIGTLRFSGNDKYLLTGTSRSLSGEQDDTLKLWAVNDTTAQPKKYVNSYGPVNTYLSDSMLNTVNVSGKVLTWNINLDATVQVDSFQHDEIGNDGMRTGQFSGAGSHLVLGDNGGKIHYLQKANGRFTRKQLYFDSPASITALDVSSDGSFIISGNNEGVVKLNYTAPKDNDAYISLHGFGDKIKDIKTSADNKRVLIQGDQHLCIWDISNPAKPDLLLKQQADSEYFRCFISPDGKWAVVKDSAPQESAMVNLANHQVIYHDSSFSGDFSSASKYFIEMKESRYLLHDLENLRLKSVDRNGSEGHFVFNQTNNWMVTESSGAAGIDSLRFWFLNTGSDSLQQASKNIKKPFNAAKFTTDTQFVGIGRADFFEPGEMFIYTLRHNGDVQEDSMPMSSASDSVVVSEKGNYMLTYDSRNASNDNPYLFSMPEFWSLKKGPGSPFHHHSFFTGETPVRAARFSHSGKFLITAGGEKSIVQIWQINADTLKLIATPAGPFSGFKTLWDFRFSKNDKFIIFYSIFGEAPYLLPTDQLPINPVPVALKNGRQGVKEIEFSPDDKHLYVYNSSKSGLSSIIGNQKLSVNVFNPLHPELLPAEIYKSNLSQLYSFQLIDCNKYMFMASDKTAEISLVDLSSLQHKLQKSIGRNLTWDEWKSFEKDADYALVADSLPPDYSVFVYIFNYLMDLHKNGNISEMGPWMKRMENYLTQAKDADLYAFVSDIYCFTLSEYALAIKASDKALFMKPAETSYKRNRGIAYWLSGNFKEAEKDISDYLSWYRTAYTGTYDAGYADLIAGYLARIRKRQRPE
jgi:hypothetical protein